MTSTRVYVHELLYNHIDDIAMANTRIQKEGVVRTRMICRPASRTKSALVNPPSVIDTYCSIPSKLDTRLDLFLHPLYQPRWVGVRTGLVLRFLTSIQVVWNWLREDEWKVRRLPISGLLKRIPLLVKELRSLFPLLLHERATETVDILI